MAEHKENIFLYEAYYVKIVKEIMTVIDLFFKHFLYIYLFIVNMCICVCARIQGTYVEFRGQLTAGCSLLLPRGSRGLRSG